MKILIILNIVILSFNSFAEFKSGDKIKAKQINNSMFMVGDIKHSLLSEQKFKTLAGDCWVKIDSQSTITLADNSTQDISDTDYGQLMGVSQLPEGEGKFLRGTGGNAKPLAQSQNFAIPDISGDVNIGVGNSSGRLLAPEGTGSFTTTKTSGSVLINSTSYSDPNYLDKIIFNPANVTNVANEVRPDNISVNYFLKVNHVCN